MSNMFSTQLALDLLYEINGHDVPLYLEPTESIDLVLPFVLPSAGFTSAKWEDLELSDVDLVIA